MRPIPLKFRLHNPTKPSPISPNRPNREPLTRSIRSIFRLETDEVQWTEAQRARGLEGLYGGGRRHRRSAEQIGGGTEAR